MAIHDKTVTNRGEGLRLVLPTSLPADERHDFRQETCEYPNENAAQGTGATSALPKRESWIDERVIEPQKTQRGI